MPTLCHPGLQGVAQQPEMVAVQLGRVGLGQRLGVDGLDEGVAELYRHHFRLLRDALQAWMAGRTQPQGMPSYADFVGGIEAALDHVRQSHTGDVMIVSSGGPISTAVGRVLGTPPETTIELNLRIRNTALTEFVFNPKRHMLLTYNTLPHLDSDEHQSWITFA